MANSQREIAFPPNEQNGPAFREWLVREFRYLHDKAVQLEELHVEPDKPLERALYFADGTDWDPGSGRGVYLYDPSGPTWRFLG